MSLTASGRGDGNVLCQSQVEALNFKFELLTFFFLCLAGYRNTNHAFAEVQRRHREKRIGEAIQTIRGRFERLRVNESTARLDGEAQGANVAAAKQQHVPKQRRWRQTDL